MSDSTQSRPWQLLIADDSKADVDLCLHELKKSGLTFTADVVSKLEEFQQKLKEKPIDVVVTDYRMSGWTGMDALATVKEIAPYVPLILLTGTLGEQLAVECIKQGVSDYVLKDHINRLPMALRRAKDERDLRESEKKAVEALREREARYRSLVDNASHGIYWTSPDGTISYVNPALVRMLGYDSQEELLAIKTTEPIFRDRERRRALREEYERNGRIDASVEWKRKDGRLITVRLSGRQSKDEFGNECVEALVEDVTERSGLEAQLLQAQKFEAIGQLAGGIAHDFNNVIGAIIGWADLGLEETEDGSPLRRHFEKVQQQAKRAAGLTRQLLAFARRQILEPREMDLNQSVAETLSLLEKVIGGNIDVKANLAANMPAVRADPTQLEQVLMNLCINARDAMPEGGRLIIETAPVFFDEEACKLQPLARPGDYAMLSVTDSGTGMDSATLDRMFEPFFTTKELGKGTGLGLATVYGVVRQHGGFIKVYSEVGIGTTFRIYMPLNSLAPPPVERHEESARVRGGKETLLVAEDHEGLRQLAVETLTKLGYAVIAAADGEEAVRTFREHKDRIDLVLLDVVLPKLNGPEVYARISALKPEIAVIFATGYSPDIALMNKVLQQNLPVLQKPYAARDLGRKVRERLDGLPARAAPGR